jgi:outer membrane protein OmpA-like peptidoglycan-associated protein
MVLNKERKMKMKRTLVYIAILFQVTVLQVKGQRDVLRYADVEYGLKRYEHAGNQYAQAYEKKATYYAAKRAAESFSQIKSYQKALDWWSKVITHAEAERGEFLNYIKFSIQLEKSFRDVDLPFSSLEMDQITSSFKNIPSHGIAWIPLKDFNRKGSDYGLRHGPHGFQYFVSDNSIEKTQTKKSFRMDIRSRPGFKEYDAYNDRGYHFIYKAKENEIKKVEIDLKGVYHVSMPSFFNRNGVDEVIFTAVVLQNNNKKKKLTTEVFPALYKAKVDENGNFKDVEFLPFNEPHKYGNMHGFVHGEHLFFASNREGGFGGYDLYVVEIKENGYSEPLNLGKNINSNSHEVFPYFHTHKLYFSSDREGGFGGLDLYEMDWADSSKLQNMGELYNSTQDDFGLFVNESGVKYISSDRGYAESFDDIYELKYLFDRIKFVVKNEDAQILKINEGISFNMYSSHLNKIDFKNPEDYNRIDDGEYNIELNFRGYFPRTLAYVQQNSTGQDKEVEITMFKIPYGKLLSLDTVFYDLDKYTIRNDGEKVLENALELLKIFPDFELHINSHTDSRASNSYNERLSKNRSINAKRHLVSQGIDADRIHIEWKGEEELLEPCPDGVYCSEDQHQKNRRSELYLKIFPDHSKQYNLPSGLRGIHSMDELFQFILQKIERN